MKLLKLRSDNPNFKTLKFNSNLSIVAGLQLSKEEKNTINGIGKSLSLTLIHLMFGSNLDPKKPKEKKLKQFLESYGTFYLTFSHKKENYEIIKNFSQSAFYLNGKEITKTDFPNELSKIFIENEHEDISFRQIFNCSARRFGGDYYNDPLRQQGQPLNDYYQRFVNLKLLNIEIGLVKERFEVAEQISKLEKAEKVIQEYQKDLDKSNLKDMQDEYKLLLDEKDNFIVAKNYDQTKFEADLLTEQLNQIRNDIQKVKNKLEKKNRNLLASENIDIDQIEIENLYKEAQFFFGDKVKKRMEESQQFHNQLLFNRKKRIEIEIKELNVKRETLDVEYNNIANKRDEKLKILDNSGALEEYNSLQEKIKQLKDEINKLTKYEETLSDFKKDKSNLNVKTAIIKEKSILYLEKQKDFLEEIENTFRSIVKKFYDNHGGSLKLKDTKNARYLYDILIEIPRGASQAIGEVEIFCYDILLYSINEKVLNFLAHDGCIFSEMDPRQKAMIFKVVIDLIKKHDLQYFINIGESTLNEILSQDILLEEEKVLLKESVILSLYDKNPTSWLFGEDFN